jgi:uncharacterized protein YjbI with pentapeptide repeats
MEIILSGQAYSNLSFKSGDYRLASFEAVVFSDCKFNKCSFHEASLIGCKFNQCTFVDCDFGLAKLTNSTFAETLFKKCQLVGINWTDTSLKKKSYLKPVDFDACVLNHSILSGLVLKKVQLSRCTVYDVDFSESDLSGANCCYSDFARTLFHHTNLGGADFRGAQNYSISVLDNVVKKARFSLPEAMALLNGLEIELSGADFAE